jgi:hypothetical protein
LNTVRHGLSKGYNFLAERRDVSMMECSEYVLETLGESGERILYRGRQHGNPLPVLIVALTAERPSPQGLRRIEHEFELRTELDPA